MNTDKDSNLKENQLQEAGFQNENGSLGKPPAKRRISRWIKIPVILLLILVLLVVIGKRILFPPYNPPKPTGELTVQTKVYTWVDESRVETFTDTGENRALTVKFWYPEEMGSYPLVVFSHGAFGVIDSNYSTFVDLASNGYVVASIGHPYHAMYVEDADGKVTTVDPDFMKNIYADNGEDYSPEAEEKIYRRSQEWMQVRVPDANFVLDTILEQAELGVEDPFTLIDTEKIGLFGHSMGGATAVALGRERNDIDAVIDLEGTMLGEYTGFTDGFEGYNEEPYPVPLLDVTSRAAYDQNLEGFRQISEKRGIDYDYVNFYVGEHAAADFQEVIFEDAGHLNFTDLPLISPPLAKLLGVGEVDPEECIGNVNQMVLSWFDHYLKGKEELAIPSVY